jgi:hypothetical protein
MLSTPKGIALARVELTALLAFASQNEADKDKWGVHFRVEKEKVFARATNGYASFQLEGINEKRSLGEWMVSRKFLVDGNKELESKQVLRLAFSGKSLHTGTVCENDKELGSWQSAADVAIPQVSFPFEDVVIPAASRTIAHCSALSTPYLKLVMLAAKAVGVEHAYWYAPAEALGPLIFTVGHDKSTSGMGFIKPLPVKEKGESGGEPDEDEEDDDVAAE